MSEAVFSLITITLPVWQLQYFNNTSKNYVLYHAENAGSVISDLLIQFHTSVVSSVSMELLYSSFQVCIYLMRLKFYTHRCGSLVLWVPFSVVCDANVAILICQYANMLTVLSFIYRTSSIIKHKFASLQYGHHPFLHPPWWK